MGLAKGALGPWSILCRQPFRQLCKKVILRLNEHGDVIIETQTECLATYLSLWLHLEQRLATSDWKHLATLFGSVFVNWNWRCRV